MIPGHPANPNFFDKKIDWTSRILANPPPPLRPITSYFCLYSPPHLKVYVVCVSPLNKLQKKSVHEIKFCINHASHLKFRKTDNFLESTCSFEEGIFKDIFEDIKYG